MNSKLLLLLSLSFFTVFSAQAANCWSEPSDYTIEVEEELYGVNTFVGSFYRILKQHITKETNYMVADARDSKRRALVYKDIGCLNTFDSNVVNTFPNGKSARSSFLFKKSELITSDGDKIQSGDLVVLEDKTKAIYMGVALEGNIILRKLEASRNYSEFKFSKPFANRPTPLVVEANTILKKLDIPEKYLQCDARNMLGMVANKTDSKIYFGEDTENLKNRCERNDYESCEAGAYNKKSFSFSFEALGMCFGTLPVTQVGNCFGVAADNSPKSKRGVKGSTFHAESFSASHPNFCQVLEICANNTNEYHEKNIYEVLNAKLECF